MSSTYWDLLDEIIRSSRIVLERPRRIKSPPIDYGYLSDTTGGDGDEIDVWKGSLPETDADAIVCTVDLRKNDAEVKVLIGCTEAEKKLICDYHASDQTAALLVRRTAPRDL